MKIIFESENFVVIEKPVGVISESDGKNGVPDILSKELSGTFFPVNRLDKNVGGVMVFAKTKRCAADLSNRIQNGIFKKEYEAIVHGKLERKSDTLTDFLFKDTRQSKAFVAKSERKGVKKAVLTYEVLEEIEHKNASANEIASRVKVNLETGRFHRIRVRFASRKNPIFGDRRYGARDEFKNPKLLCRKISFFDSEKNERVSFVSETVLSI